MQSAKYYVIILGLCLCLSQRTQTLLWRHNGRDCVSNHQPHDCFLNRLFSSRSKKTSKLRVTGLCAGNSPGTRQRILLILLYHHSTYCSNSVTGLIAKMAEQFFRSQPISSWVFVLPLINILRPRQNGRHFGRRRIHVHSLGWRLLNFK